MIHKLQDLCYAYAVADPVRDMMFALQDRITELEAQRKPLTDEQIMKMYGLVFVSDVDGYSIHGRLRFARAVEAAHGIKD